MTDETRVDMLLDGLKPVESSEAAPAVPTAPAVPVQPQSVAPPPATTATVTPTPVKATVVAPKPGGGVGVVSPSITLPSIKIVQTPVITPPPVTGLSAAVNKASGRALPVPKGITLGTTADFDKEPQFFHGCVYSETSARKTTTAARFGSADDVRIVLTRRKEQLTPLKNLGYKYAAVTDGEALMFALTYPEQLWPDWAQRPNRTLVLDDATEAVTMLLEDASEIDGKAVKDQRRSYREAGDNLREVVRSILRKPMNFVMTALAKVKDNPITNEERIGPDLPPSMMNLLLTELEYVFYINPKTWMMYTDRDRISVTDVDPQSNKERTYIREIFAKNKFALDSAGKVVSGVLMQQEKLDLAVVWAKIQSGKPAIAAAPAKK